MLACSCSPHRATPACPRILLTHPRPSLCPVAGEQTLENYELCCLVETFPDRADDLDDYLATLRSAFLYAKTVTLGATEFPMTNKALLRNRRIGTSMSGIAQFIAHRGLAELKRWSEVGYARLKECDVQYSKRFCVPKSIKITSIKPSGTVSLLAGATPGVHFPESRFYIRRVRLAEDSELLGPLREAGFHVEPCTYSASTSVVSIPIDAGEGVRTLDDVSFWEQLAICALLQRVWADNQVSCTVTFDPDTEGKDIARALDVYQFQLKSVSFLPRKKGMEVYKQAPYEQIDGDRYEEMMGGLSAVAYDVGRRSPKLNDGLDDDEVVPQTERFCDGDTCMMVKQ